MTQSNNYPATLYKYRVFNDFAKKILIEGQLFFPSASMLNDPFDGAIPFVYDPNTLTEANIKQAMWNDLKAKNIPENEREPFIEEVYKKENWKNVQTQTKIKEGFKKLIEENYGILSLTKKNDNYLMWSHYADSHKGICIGLDRKKLTELSRTFAKVGYSDSDDLPKIPFTVSKERQLECAIELLFTKANFWEYEEEYRIVKFNYAGKPLKVSLDCIKEIIIGHSMPEVQQKELKAILKCYLPHVKLYKASLSSSKFKLDINEIAMGAIIS